MTGRDFSIFDDSPWLVGGPARLGQARGVPTMMSHEEELLCHWLTAQWADGWGTVVDLGAFVGGATARLAEGQRTAGHSTGVHAYDRFAVAEGHKQKFLYGAGVAPFADEDALAVAEALLAPWADQVTLHKGDLRRATWSADRPIEVLVVDATKAAATTDRIARVFYPALRPGSVVVQRGYLHWREPWVAVHMHRLRDVLVPIGHATDDSVIFGCVATPSDDVVRAAATEALSDMDMMRDLLAAQEVFARYGAEGRLLDLVQGIERSPGKRASWAMVPRR